MTPPQLIDSVEGYEQFFGLREPPFSLAPDPRFLFSGASHSAALKEVTYAMERREPLVVITGDIGTGKTLLCRTVLDRLPGRTFLSIVSDPLLSEDDLLKQMLEDFGVISKDRSRMAATTRHDLVHALHAFLSTLVPIQSHAVVIVDEAQHLKPEVLEQIRLLSSIGDARGSSLGIILVGQPDLDAVLARPELRQLQQRVSRRLRVAALNRDEVQRYIEHRLSRARVAPAAAANNAVFTSTAFDAVATLSQGVPRVINLICDRALEVAFASKERSIDRAVVEAAARQLGLASPSGAVATKAAAITAPAVGLVTPPVDVAAPAASAPVPTPAVAAPAGMWSEAPFGKDPSVGQIPSHSGSADDVFHEVPTIRRQSAAPKFVVPAAAVVLLGLAGLLYWSGWLTGGRPAANSPAPGRPAAPARAPARPSTPPASAATPGPAAPNTNAGAPVPGVSGAAPASAAHAATENATAPAGSAAAAGERFEIVIASFRTEARATSVGAEVTALGLPTRIRVSDGWQQLLAGPFQTRNDAIRAQERLDNAGLTETQIVVAAAR
ncbi:MAG TPA: AAA family ATPase [Vicinamibacterales bacterium]|nr:AAA family ATPase [Vicinamibacterales bacterium]